MPLFVADFVDERIDPLYGPIVLALVPNRKEGAIMAQWVAASLDKTFIDSKLPDRIRDVSTRTKAGVPRRIPATPSVS